MRGRAFYVLKRRVQKKRWSRRLAKMQEKTWHTTSQGKADVLSLAEILAAVRLLDAATVKPDANGMVYIEVRPYRYGSYGSEAVVKVERIERAEARDINLTATVTIDGKDPKTFEEFAWGVPVVDGKPDPA